MITGEHIDLPRGTVEHLIVQVKDRLENVTDLATLDPKYDIRRKGADTYFVAGATAVAVGMTLYCLVDTRPTDYDESGTFELFAYFDNLPELPRLGPHEFDVNN